MKITLFKEKSFSILMSIIDIGESGSKKAVLDNIREKGYLNLNDVDLAVKHNRNELYWRNDLAFIRKKLVVEGYLNDSEKNNWRITEDGKRYLINLCEEMPNSEISDLKKLSNLAIEKAKMFIVAFRNNEEQVLINVNKIPSNLLSQTEKEQLIKIRIGQGVFKNKLLNNDNKCKICGLPNQELLIASHVKPWKDSDNMERLDVNNGFLLCPNHDSLFDKGYITFDDEGKIIISNLLKINEYNLLNISNGLIISINNENKKYLQWHRTNVFNSKDAVLL